jgi:hypothetical protein
MHKKSTLPPPNPSGLCQCGCGERTPISKETRTATGNVRGFPVRYLTGHHRRTAQPIPEMTVILCACGCGGRVAVSPYPSTQRRYIHGHHAKRQDALYAVNPDTGCWDWQRPLDQDGYGRIVRSRKTRPAHVWFYEQKYGSIPHGWDAHHTCENRRCVNPDHIEPMPKPDHTALHRRRHG